MFGGRVVHGDGMGKQYGYPTANIDCKKQSVTSGGGVYAGFAHIGHVQYRAAVAIQENPWKVEVHVLDYPDEDLYGQYIGVDLIQKVSELERYNEKTELIEKIKKDIEMVKEMLEISK